MATAADIMPIILGDPRQPKAFPVDHPKSRVDAFKTETTVLPKGYVRRQGCLALFCDILFEKDQPVKLRDGTTVFADIYRPHSASTKAPAILAWSPYGKTGGGGCQILDDVPFRCGVPLSSVSELQKWEGPDPAYWVQHGYAVVNADPRGAGRSDGDILVFGTQDAEDGADVVDWIGERSWCNGKVGMSGNSWLAVAQWFIAAQRPKHLAAIAPWEGFSDLYREGVLFGGVESAPPLNFLLQVLSINRGENSWENVAAMHFQHRKHGSYHADKAAKVEEIDVPAYVAASWTNVIHVYGTFRSFQRLQSPKWLRVHDTSEWPDYYDEKHTTDLHRFFDRYLKGVENGWEATPRLRAKILDTADPLPNTSRTITASEFPPETTPLTLFFDGKRNSLTSTYPQNSGTSYKASTENAVFEYTFQDDTTLCGPIDLKLAVSITGSNDSDTFIQMEKVLVAGSAGEQLTIPFSSSWQTSLVRTGHWLALSKDTKMIHYRGPKGQIRLSRRREDTALQVPGFPLQRMDVIDPVTEGDIVVVKPPMYPIGMFFRAGENLRVRINGVDESSLPPMPMASLEVENVEDVNKSAVVTVHCGSDDVSHGSCITLPVLKV